MEITVIDITFVLAVVAFFKERANLKGWYSIGAAFLAVLFIAFLPDIVALFPQAQAAVDKIVFIVKLFLTAPGIFDLVTNVGEKIRNAPVA